MRIQRGDILAQIRIIRQSANQRIRDLGYVKGSLRKRLIEIERMCRDVDVEELKIRLQCIHRRILPPRFRSILTPCTGAC